MYHIRPDNSGCRSRDLFTVALAALLTIACTPDGGNRPTAGNDPGLSTATVRHARAARSHRVAGANEAADKPLDLEVFAPGEGDHAGVEGLNWFVDLDVEFPGNIRSTGFTGAQLTGPGVHNNVRPFPGVFAPGKDDRFGGLVVLFSTTAIGASACQNTANLFNITGVTDATESGTEIWDTWIITSASFGRTTASTLYVAMVSDLNGDGIYNDAPDVLADANSDGRCDESDLEALGTASEVTTVHFFIR